MYKTEYRVLIFSKLANLPVVLKFEKYTLHPSLKLRTTGKGGLKNRAQVSDPKGPLRDLFFANKKI